MKRLLLAPILLLALAASAQAKIPHRYWWVPTSSCVITGTPYSPHGLPAVIGIKCKKSGGIGWRDTPEPMNISDSVNPTGALPPYCADDGNVLPCLGPGATP